MYYVLIKCNENFWWKNRIPIQSFQVHYRTPLSVIWIKFYFLNNSDTIHEWNQKIIKSLLWILHSISISAKTRKTFLLSNKKKNLQTKFIWCDDDNVERHGIVVCKFNPRNLYGRIQESFIRIIVITIQSNSNQIKFHFHVFFMQFFKPFEFLIVAICIF